MIPRLTCSALAFLTFTGSVTSSFAYSKVECSEAHFSAQRARASGALLSAESYLVTCGDETCPDVLRNECGQWSGELRSEIPSVIVAVQTTEGADLLTHDFRINGKSIVLPYEKALKLDPGIHTFSVTAPGFQAANTTILLRVGEQNRRINLRLEAAPEIETPTARPAWPLYIFGGVAAGGAVGFAVFGSIARDSEHDLESCAPVCSEQEVRAVRTEYAAANISLAVGAAALVSGGVWWILSSPPPGDGAKAARTSWGISPLGPSFHLHARF